MKKFYSFLFAAVALVGFAACNSDSTEEPAPAQENVGKMEFMANIGEDTKTQLTGGTKVIWCAGDVIGVVVPGYNDNKPYQFTIKELLNDGKSAVFTGEAPLSASHYYAIYPYYADASYSNGSWNFTVPANQAAVNGSFADGAAASTATAAQGVNTLNFSNICAVLKFQVPATCNKVSFASENANVTVEGEMTDEGVYYAVVPATSHKFTVRINGYLSKASENTLSAKANTIYNLGTLPAPVASDWGLVGAFNSWDTNNKATMYVEGDNFVVRNFEGGEFKFVKGNSWDVSRSIRGKDVLTIGSWNMIGANSNNISLVAGNYDIYLNRSNGVFNVVNAGTEIADYVLPEGKAIYLQAGVWTASEAYFEAWVWGAGDQWCDFADIDDSGIFRAIVPDGTTDMKILRKNPSSASHSWSSWNDSGNQTIPANKNMFIVNGWDNYSWGTK